ncbi:MAG TPA: biotin/lipoyl-binding protein [Candidatus Anaerofilum faecale]|nr:biotin/lipoyl-binding protein [Candidatus Anaerofilum faecale]
MERIKEIRQRLRAAVQSSEPGQRRALGRAGRFFAAMLVCTLVARGASGATMAEVSLEKPASANLSDSLTASGTIEAAAPSDIEVPEGLKVTEVAAAAGQKVNAGDLLAKVDADELDRAVRAQQAQVQKQQLALEALREEQPVDSSGVDAAQTALAGAQADRDRANGRAAEAVQQAETALERAKQDEQAASDALEELQQKPPEELEEGELEAAQLALDTARSARETAEQALASARQAAEDTALSGDRSVASAESALQSAQKSYSEAAKQAETAGKANAADAQLAQLELEEAQRLLDRLTALQQAGGCITAPAGGTLVRLDLTAGQPTVASAGQLAGQEGGFVFRATVGKEQAGQLKAGGLVNVQQDYAVGRGTIQALSPQEDGTVQMTVRLAEDGASWQLGGAEASVTLSQQQYYTCLPSSAVRLGSAGQYVLVMEQRVTVLGIQNVLVEVPVSIERISGGTTAVSGALGPDSQVVASSSRPVSAGDRVRVKG